MMRTLSRWLGVALLAGIVPNATAQDDLRQHASSACAVAREQAAAGDWDRAQARLARELAQLPPAGADTKAAGAIIRFTSAWLHEERATAVEKQDKARAASELEKAQAGYRRILADYPKNGQAALNLALLLDRTGQQNDAIGVLQATIERGAADAFRLKLAVGDLLVRHDRPGEAWAKFMELATSEPSKDHLGLHQRLVQLYRRLPERDPARFYAYCLELKDTGFQHLAGEGMVEIVNHSWAQAPEIAEKALLEWTGQRVREDRLDAQDLLRLPAEHEWNPAALAGLRQLVSGDPDQARWWLSEPVRQHSASGVLRLRANQLARAERTDQAVALYQTAIRIAPELGAYSVGGKPALQREAVADLQAAAAMAQVLQRAVGKLDDQLKLGNDDPRTKAALSGKLRKFNALLDSAELNGRLDRAGSPAPDRFQSGVIDGVRQYHLTFGAIHVERKQFAAAQRHLEQLVNAETAQALVDKRAPQPQAQVATLLAEAYRATGKDAAATKSYLEASWGYLLEDDAKNAQASLAKLRRRQLDPAARQQLQIVEQSIELEKRLINTTATPNSPEWRRLGEIHAAIPPATADTTKAWSAAYLRSVSQRSEIVARKAGNATTGEAWKNINGTLPAIDNDKVKSIPRSQLDRQRELRHLRNPAATKTIR